MKPRKSEEWRNVNGYKGRYQVSNMGRIKSLSRKVYNSGACSVKTIKERILKQCIANRYLVVTLCDGDNQETAKVHHIVARVLHKNDVQTDNRSCNIYYGTPSDMDTKCLGVRTPTTIN